MAHANEKSYNIAIIGAGNIVPFHIDAINATGLNVDAISASLNSKRALELAHKYKINKHYNNSLDLILSDSWDGLVIACDIESTLEYLELAVTKNKPILVEKPVSLSSKNLMRINLEQNKVLVGFNRRFYENILYLKGITNTLKPTLISVEIPENLNILYSNIRMFPVLSNSVHVLDLLGFLFGELNISYIQHLNSVGSLVTLTSNRGDLILIKMNYNASANFSITIDAAPVRFILKPLEILTIIDGMEVKLPDKHVPVRRYEPNVRDQKFADLSFKPGFINQFKEFKSMLDGESRVKGASLNDTLNTIRLVENIIRDYHEKV